MAIGYNSYFSCCDRSFLCTHPNREDLLITLAKILKVDASVKLRLSTKSLTNCNVTRCPRVNSQYLSYAISAHLAIIILKTQSTAIRLQSSKKTFSKSCTSYWFYRHLRACWDWPSLLLLVCVLFPLINFRLTIGSTTTWFRIRAASSQGDQSRWNHRNFERVAGWAKYSLDAAREWLFVKVIDPAALWRGSDHDYYLADTE
jgi:hypothetical protein